MNELTLDFQDCDVIAYRNGEKTQARVVLPVQPTSEFDKVKAYHLKSDNGFKQILYRWMRDGKPQTDFFELRSFKQGCSFWVCEPWDVDPSDASKILYQADFPEDKNHVWLASQKMPLLHSRFELTVKDFRVERLQSISLDDVMAEGLMEWVMRIFNFYNDVFITTKARLVIDQSNYLRCFHHKWNEAHGIGAFEKNPVVAVIEFDSFTS